MSGNHNHIFTHSEGIDRNQFIIARYLVKPSAEKSLKDVALYLAFLMSTGTTSPLTIENLDTRLDNCARILLLEESGHVEIAIPLVLCGSKIGIGDLLGIVTYASEYRIASEIRLEQLSLPPKLIKSFKGPRFGIDGLRKSFEVYDRPILGVIIKPRLGLSLPIILEHCQSCLEGGIDYVIDDEILVNPETDMNFENRVRSVMKIIKLTTKSTKTKKSYVVNIGTSFRRAVKYAKLAQEEGVAALLTNCFTGGFPFIEELLCEKKIQLPIMTCNMGTGIITRQPNRFGISETVIAKLSRFAGADAVNTGPISGDWYADAMEDQVLTGLSMKLPHFKSSMPVISGGITIDNICENVSTLGNDIMIQSGRGILGYKTGSFNAGKAFRTVIEELQINPHQNHDMVFADVVAKNEDIRKNTRN